MPDIKLGSLFDGIGVFPLAASRCGIRPVWASEIEKAPISITKRHFPDMVHLGDITKVDGGKIPPVHIITFGSPCQNLSLIGNRSGLAGAKSSLFYQAFRIIQEMRDATDNLYPAIRTKKMVADPVAADHVRLMFEMYTEPETSFGDITRYFEEQGIKIYEKSMVRSFLSQLLRNPVYAQADLELYEFFKSQGAAIVNDASDFAGTNGCYLYQGRDVKEDKDRCLKDQILVIAPHEALIPSDTWLKCRKKLMANTTFQQGRKPKNTWLAGKIKCGHCGYALKATHVPNSTGYFRCTKRTENKGCPGCGKIRKEEFEQFIFSAMQEKFKDFQILHGREEKVNPKLTAYQVELAQVEAEIEKLLDTLTGANATLLAYANKKIEELDTRRQTISKAIAELSVETISPQQIKKLSYYLDNWESIDFDDKRKAADGLISTIKATSDRVQIEWKI